MINGNVYIILHLFSIYVFGFAFYPHIRSSFHRNTRSVVYHIYPFLTLSQNRFSILFAWVFRKSVSHTRLTYTCLVLWRHHANSPLQSFRSAIKLVSSSVPTIRLFKFKRPLLSTKCRDCMLARFKKPIKRSNPYVTSNAAKWSNQPARVRKEEREI